MDIHDDHTFIWQLYYCSKLAIMPPGAVACVHYNSEEFFKFYYDNFGGVLPTGIKLLQTW